MRASRAGAREPPSTMPVSAAPRIGLTAAGPGGLAVVATGYVPPYVSGEVPGPLTLTSEALHERIEATPRKGRPRERTS